ncbi:Replication factor C (RF-C) subunit [Kappamyces sp. JEL0680]|nr:Replication factor C (RF-C) subunit [Kappamyces sp. JEL0680]
MLVYGPSGAGKKTRITAVLKEMYGAGAEKLKIETRQFTTTSSRKLDIHVVSSNYHIEITPSDLGIYDRVVIQDLIKELAQTRQLDAQAKHKFKMVVFNEADTLSRGAQAALRRTMEKYMSNMRVILCCNVTSKIIAPIRSRCLMVRVPSPSTDQMCKVLQYVATQEKLVLPSTLAVEIASVCEGNMRKAILMLEALYVQKYSAWCNRYRYPFTEHQPLPTTDWELFIQDIASCIMRDQSPKW